MCHPTAIEMAAVTRAYHAADDSVRGLHDAVLRVTLALMTPRQRHVYRVVRCVGVSHPRAVVIAIRLAATYSGLMRIARRMRMSCAVRL